MVRRRRVQRDRGMVICYKGHKIVDELAGRVHTLMIFNSAVVMVGHWEDKADG